MLRLLALGLLLCLLAPMTRAQEATREAEVTPETTAIATPAEVRQYERLTLRVDVDPALYSNPFDPSDLEVVAIFDAPDGRQYVIPGFWLQPYTDACNAPCVQERLRAQGDPEWQVRFAPDVPGRWTYSLQVRDNGSLVRTVEGEVEVATADRDGFIGVAPNRRYFSFSDATPYFPIGHNLHWSWQGSGGWHAYERWFDSLAASGGNYARLIVDVPWFVGLEWEVPGDYSAAQEHAYRLDQILDLAAAHGIRLQLVLLWSQSLREYNGPPVLVPAEPARPDTSVDWDNNPYNSARGGFLSVPSQFFNNETAVSLFRRRLRYIAARWGYSPDVFAWELTDELDRVTSNDDITVLWVQDMVSYLREVDQNRHLITVGSRSANDRLLSTPLLDFTQTRVYQSLPIESTFEQVPTVVASLRRALLLNNTPSLLTGFSLNPWYEPTESDPAGVHFQNTLWASVLAGASGGAASEWGSTYVIPRGLQRYYAPLAAFVAGVDWAALDLRPAEAALLSAEADGYAPVRISGFARQFRVPPTAAVTRTISADGVYPSTDGVTGYVYGRTYNTEFAQPQVYRVIVPVDTYLEVGVRLVSDLSGARLSVVVDDAAPVEMALAASSRGGALRVPLSVGEHQVTISNSGDDWLELDYIQVDHLVAPARALTLRDEQNGVALAWLQHRGYTWDAVAAEAAREPLTLTYRLDAMPSGRYLLELWEPLTGAVLGEEIVRVEADGVLRFDLLPLHDQLALRAFRQPDAPTPTLTPQPESTLAVVTPTLARTPEVTPEPSAATPTARVTVQPTPSPSVTPMEPEATEIRLTSETQDSQPTREAQPDAATATPTVIRPMRQSGTAAASPPIQVTSAGN